MPISYAERKKRRQTLLRQLAPELRQRLALRHVEAVAKLPPEGQRTLTSVLSTGLRGIPEAIAFLHEQPQASAEEVLRAGKDVHRERASHPSPRPNLSCVPTEPDPGALAELSDLLQGCFPGMPPMTAEALAADELFSGVLALVRARQACFNSTSFQSELVFVVLCGLALQFIEELNRLMDSRPHYRGALVQSGLGSRLDRALEAGEQGRSGAREILPSSQAPQHPSSIRRRWQCSNACAIPDST